MKNFVIFGALVFISVGTLGWQVTAVALAIYFGITIAMLALT